MARKTNKRKKNALILKTVFGHYQAAIDVAITFFQGESYSWDEETACEMKKALLSKARECFNRWKGEDTLANNKVKRRIRHKMRCARHIA